MSADWDKLAETTIKPLLIERGLPAGAADETAVEIIAKVMNWLGEELNLG